VDGHEAAGLVAVLGNIRSRQLGVQEKNQPCHQPSHAPHQVSSNIQDPDQYYHHNSRLSLQ